MKPIRPLPPLLAVLPFILLLTACGAKRFTPPSGPGAPFPDHAAAYDEATADCRGVKTITATLSLSGRAGRERLRGRVDAGFAAPGAVRLEGRAPFGRPVFVLVSRDDEDAMLVLPRDNRILRNAPPSAIVEALTGVALTAAELRSAVAGCGFGAIAPTGARIYGDTLVLDAADATYFLRRKNGRWRLAAATRGPVTIEYRDPAGRRPATIAMRSTGSSTAPTELTVQLSDVTINVALDNKVFSEDVPADATVLTLDELRRAGPLGGAAPR